MLRSVETLIQALRTLAIAQGHDSPKTLVARNTEVREWLKAEFKKKGLDPRILLDSWRFTARHKQLAPDGDYRIWLMKTGRRFGKNWSLSHWLHEKAGKYPGQTFFIAGRTKDDVRKTTIKGASGLLKLQRKSNPCEYKVSEVQVEWANGSIAHMLTSEEPDGCRGPGYAAGIADELAAWKRNTDGKGNTLWNNLQFATSVRLPNNDMPQIAVGTTPVPSELITKLVALGRSDSPRVVLTEGSIYENRANLGRGFIEEIEADFKGTHLFQQEAMGNLLESVEGAILTATMLEESRVESLDDCPKFQRIVIGVDPAAKSKKTSDLSGINVVGLGADGELYSLADRSLRASPEGVARAVCDAYWDFDDLGEGPSRIVLEDNQGGEWLKSVVSNYENSPPPNHIQARTAKASKGKRFSSICPWWERGHAHIVGHDQKQLETELCGFTMNGLWEGAGSPDRADAHVWAARELVLQVATMTWAEMNSI